MKKAILTLLISIISLTAAIGQQKRESYPLRHGAHRTGKRTDAEMKRWRGHALGQFIHWGVYAIPGGQWNGKSYQGAAEWIRSWTGMPNEEYDNLYKQFNPSEFNARKWAKQAREMGVKYMIFTTKHHDGFCMWPSRYTEYSVKNTPYGQDIVRQIVDAYTKEGIDVHLYFSIIDWNHHGYSSAAPSTEEAKGRYEEFKQFTRNQLLELTTNYPDIKGLWFDGSWDKAWIEQAAWVDALGVELRETHPGLIIGSRFRADENGKRHYDSNGDLIDDYDQTWERDLPDSIEQLYGNDWDCVMTIPQNQWGYNAEWGGYIKTSHELIEMMVRAVSMDGNFVVNFGPDGKGNIRPQEGQIAREMGGWTKRFGEAVYGAGYAGLKEQGWGYYTSKGSNIYLSVFNRPLDDRVHVEIGREGAVPVKAYLLDTGKPLEIINAGKNKRNANLYKVVLPDDYRPRTPFVVVLETVNAEDKGEYMQAKT